MRPGRGGGEKGITAAIAGAKEDPAAFERGAVAYAKNCAGCHGANGRGSVGAPDLVRSVLVLDDEKGILITPLLKNGRPDEGMPKPNLTEAQISGSGGLAACADLRRRPSHYVRVSGCSYRQREKGRGLLQHHMRDLSLRHWRLERHRRSLRRVCVAGSLAAAARRSGRTRGARRRGSKRRFEAWANHRHCDSSIWRKRSMARWTALTISACPCATRPASIARSAAKVRRRRLRFTIL